MNRITNASTVRTENTDFTLNPVVVTGPETVEPLRTKEDHSDQNQLV